MDIIFIANNKLNLQYDYSVDNIFEAVFEIYDGFYMNSIPDL